MLRLILLLVFSSKLLLAQELNCKVEVVNTSATQTEDPQIYKSMEKAVYEFMNNRKWTGHVFKAQEKIECIILINITGVSGGNYTAKTTIKSSRPVFNSSYNTVILNHIDKEFTFAFNEFTPLEFNENVHLNNFTSLLAFYAYVIIALDYESFQPRSGTTYLAKANKIVSNAQGAPEKGWKSFESNRNRYWMLENYMSPKYQEIRIVNYDYHRKGMDVMSGDAKKARAVVTNCLKKLLTMNRKNPNSMVIQMFFNAKNEELVGMFKGAPLSEKTVAVDMLSRLDPTRATKYSSIME